MRPDDARQLSLDFLELDYAYLLCSGVVWNARVSRSGVPGKPEQPVGTTVELNKDVERESRTREIQELVSRL